MAYGNDSTLRKFIGSDWVDGFTGLNGSTASEVQTEARSDADAEIDEWLVPSVYSSINDIADSTATPRQIQTISNMLTVAYLAEKRHAEGIDANHFRDLAYRRLERIIEKRPDLDGADLQTGDDSRYSISWNSGDERPKFAGYDPDDDNTDRMANW